MVEINKTITLKLIFFISIIALSSAFFIEHVLGHQPCNLCILERIPYLLASVSYTHLTLPTTERV